MDKKLLACARLAAKELRKYWENDLTQNGPGMMPEGLESLEAIFKEIDTVIPNTHTTANGGCIRFHKPDITKYAVDQIWICPDCAKVYTRIDVLNNGVKLVWSSGG